MNIRGKIWICTIITACSVVFSNHVDEVISYASSAYEGYASNQVEMQTNDESYEFENEINCIQMIRNPLDAEFFEVVSILSIGLVASVMLRLR